MSISAGAIGELPIAADPVPPTSTKKVPPKRIAVASADAVLLPEAR